MPSRRRIAPIAGFPYRPPGPYHNRRTAPERYPDGSAPAPGPPAGSTPAPARRSPRGILPLYPNVPRRGPNPPTGRARGWPEQPAAAEDRLPVQLLSAGSRANAFCRDAAARSSKPSVCIATARRRSRSVCKSKLLSVVTWAGGCRCSIAKACRQVSIASS